MNVYIYKQKSFDDLYQTTKCDIGLVRTPDGLTINESQLLKGDIIFDVDGSCGVVKTIVKNLFTVLVVSKVNTNNTSNINRI
ncbi:MAG: hypothetical protein SPJ27_00240 [Candidatus Onthovivens sp.]|nr:hypothetical protein [Candidatus Onthovivens sp.]